ncbi:MAG: TIGR04141 family sporadically distributed protein [Acidobacteriota bacterium]
MIKAPTVTLTIYLAKKSVRHSGELLLSPSPPSLAYREHVLRLPVDGEATEADPEGVDAVDDSIDPQEELGRLYVAPGIPKAPGWASFLAGGLDDLSVIGTAQSPSALLMMAAQGRIFAVTFGNGRFLLDRSQCESRFGLLVTLNSIDASRVRSLDTQHIDAIAKKSREQAIRDAEPWEFGIDFAQAVLRGVTGTPLDVGLGRRLSGRDALSATLNLHLADLPDQLARYLERFTADTYKESFRWIDLIEVVSDPAEEERLDDALLALMQRQQTDRIHLTAPGMIEWEDVLGFRYPGQREVAIELSFPALMSLEMFQGSLTMELLRGSRIRLLSFDDEMLASWSVYQCLHAELVRDDRRYLLSEGIWYRIDLDLVLLVDRAIAGLDDCDLALPEYRDRSEEAYNLQVSHKANPNGYFALMDRKLLSYGGGYSRIELCDLYTTDRHMVHVKRYRGSSSLSHLFAQGLVAGQAFAVDPDFREEADRHLPETHRLDPQALQKNAYHVVFAVVGGPEKLGDLPFFSRLAMIHAARQLAGLRYRVSVVRVATREPARPKSSETPKHSPSTSAQKPATDDSPVDPPPRPRVEIHPRRWQKEALERWTQTQRGIVEVVTGAGKTIFALLCVEKFLERYPNGRIVIIVPTLALLDQWMLDVADVTGFPEREIGCFSGQGQPDAPRRANILVLNTARRLTQTIADGELPTLLIVDECHHAGSPHNARALQGEFQATLGLSATPDRDDQGHERNVVPVLGEIFYRYGYAEAKDDGVIVDFLLVNIGIEDLDARPDLSQHTEAGMPHKHELMALLRNQVAVKLALDHRDQRLIIFHERIEELEVLDGLLEQHGLRSITYHSDMETSHRRDNLRRFRRGLVGILLTCRALDEGANIPEANVAIVARSTRSTRQRIQRLGRVLRPAPGKREATVYTLYSGHAEEQLLAREESELEGVVETQWKRIAAAAASST